MSSFLEDDIIMETKFGSTKQRMELFMINIRKQDTVRIFRGLRRNYEKPEKDSLTLTLEELTFKVKEIEKGICDIINTSDIDQAVKIFDSLLITLIGISQSNRESVVEKMKKKKLFHHLIMILNEARKKGKNELISSITWAMQVALTVKTNTVTRIVEHGLIEAYEPLLLIQDTDILENVIWGYSNMVEDNLVVRELMESKQLMERVYSTIEQSSDKIFSIPILQSFVLFSNSYFNQKPNFKFQTFANHFYFCVKVFISIDAMAYSEFMVDLLTFLKFSTKVGQQSDIFDFLECQLFIPLIDKLSDLVLVTESDIADLSISVLLNLTYHDHPRLIEILNTNLLKNLYINISKDILLEDSMNLVANIAASGDEFLSSVLKSGIVTEILCRTASEESPFTHLVAKVSVLSNIFDCHPFDESFDYINEHFDLIAMIVTKLNNSLNFSMMKVIGKFLRSIFEIGYDIMITRNLSFNPISQRFSEREDLSNAIEKAQSNRSSEIYNIYKSIIEEYFPVYHQ